MILSVDLPYPPSANRLWRFVPGKPPLKSREYRTWMGEASWLIKAAVKAPRIDGHYGLTIMAGRRDNRKRDLDNLIKPINDALKEGGAIRDDSDCQIIHAEWSSNFLGVRVTVLPTKGAA